MIFRQLFEPESSTYTYLLGCSETWEAVLVDPVLETWERDLEAVQAMGLTLAWTLDTHVHADHLTSALKLRSVADSRIAVPGATGIGCADLGVAEDRPLEVGTLLFKPLFTPGHTDHHHCYLIDDGTQGRVMTGDCLLIDGCGRTDFQSGSSKDLYRSVHEKLFTLPEDTLVLPAHDYKGRRVSTIGQEKDRNPRLGGGKSLADFEKIMAGLDLPYPKKIDLAVPANERCGQCPDDMPDEAARLCEPAIQG